MTMQRPPVVTLCGSTRFKEEYLTAQRELTREGIIILTVGEFGHADRTDADSDTRLKERLDELHLRKIDLSDAIVVINPGGYIGESTRREIAYARRAGKLVTFWMTYARWSGLAARFRVRVADTRA